MPRNISSDEFTVRVVERTKLILAEQCLAERGSLYTHLTTSGAAVPELRSKLRAQALAELAELTKGAARGSTRQLAEALLRDPKAVLPPRSRRPRGAPVPPPPAPVSDPWKYLQLRIDWTRCVKETALEYTTDEMYLVGVLIDLGAPDIDRRKISFHLGDFRSGDFEGYAGSRVVSYAKIDNAASFPTGIKCLLSVIEKDADGAFAELLDDLIDIAKHEIDDQLEDDDGGVINEDGEIDWEKLLKKLVDVLFGWIKNIPAPEILEYHTRPVFEFVSPTVASLADTWTPSHTKAARTFTVKGHGGEYRINLFFQRSRTPHGA